MFLPEPAEASTLGIDGSGMTAAMQVTGSESCSEVRSTWKLPPIGKSNLSYILNWTRA